MKWPNRSLQLVLASLAAAAVVLSGLVSLAGDPSMRGTRRCYATDGACHPNPLTYGYYPTQWRRWPIEPPAVPSGPKKADAQSVEPTAPTRDTGGAAPGSNERSGAGPSGVDKPPTPPANLDLEEFPDVPRRSPTASPFELQTPELDLPGGSSKLPSSPFKTNLNESPFGDDSQLDPPPRKPAERDGSLQPAKIPPSPQAKRNLHWGQTARPASAIVPDEQAKDEPPDSEVARSHSPATSQEASLAALPALRTPPGFGTTNPLRHSGAPGSEASPTRGNPLRAR